MRERVRQELRVGVMRKERVRQKVVLTLVSPVQKRVNTSLMFPPFCMLMTRR